MVYNNSGNAKGNTGLQLEDYEVDTEYSITINLKSQPDSEAQFFPWHRLIYDRLVQFREIVSLKLYLESSSTGRLHWHGTVTIRNLQRLYIFLQYLNEHSHFEIDRITNHSCTCVGFHNLLNPHCYFEKWERYIKKQFNIWHRVFHPVDKHKQGHSHYYPMIISEDSDPILKKYSSLKAIKKKKEIKNLQKFGYEDQMSDSSDDIDLIHDTGTIRDKRDSIVRPVVRGGAK